MNGSSDTGTLYSAESTPKPGEPDNGVETVAYKDNTGADALSTIGAIPYFVLTNDQIQRKADHPMSRR